MEFFFITCKLHINDITNYVTKYYASYLAVSYFSGKISSVAIRFIYYRIKRTSALSEKDFNKILFEHFFFLDLSIKSFYHINQNLVFVFTTQQLQYSTAIFKMPIIRLLILFDQAFLITNYRQHMFADRNLSFNLVLPSLKQTDPFRVFARSHLRLLLRHRFISESVSLVRDHLVRRLFDRVQLDHGQLHVSATQVPDRDKARVL